ncbi:antitermination protein NusB [Mycoplasmopsis cynos]|nr:antitermination protein NusB [Mycoplasmopsis cynos]
MEAIKKHKSMRTQRVEIINEIYRTELLEEHFDYQQIIIDNIELTSLQISRLNEIQQRYEFIKKIYGKLINKDWTWDRISPLIRAILINAANEFWSVETKIVINEAIEITKMFFGSPELDEIETIDNRLYRFVNALLQNFYKTLLHLEMSTK